MGVSKENVQTLNVTGILNKHNILNLPHDKAFVFECIETYYNKKRSHVTLDYVSPKEFER